MLIFYTISYIRAYRDVRLFTYRYGRVCAYLVGLPEGVGLEQRPEGGTEPVSTCVGKGQRQRGPATEGMALAALTMTLPLRPGRVARLSK